jgi:4-hydroxy-4-methyl-2-oxoglutarate aldolase
MTSFEDNTGKGELSGDDTPVIPDVEMSTDHISDSARDNVVMSRDIHRIWDGAKIQGAPVMTAQVPPGDNKTLFEAIDKASPGEVIVVNGNGFMGRSLWGAIMSYAAMKRGVVGLVVDGFVRDKEDLERLRFPVFARGVTPIAPRPRRSGAIGLPIMCGGLRVSPGDFLFADADGVVVIEHARKEEVLQRAWERARAEDETFRALQMGSSMAEVIGSLLTSSSPPLSTHK